MMYYGKVNSLFMWFSYLFMFIEVLIEYGLLDFIYVLFCMMCKDFESFWDGFFDIMVFDGVFCFEEIKVFGD